MNDSNFFFHVAFRPQKQYGLLGTGGTMGQPTTALLVHTAPELWHWPVRHETHVEHGVVVVVLGVPEIRNENA